MAILLMNSNCCKRDNLLWRTSSSEDRDYQATIRQWICKVVRVDLAGIAKSKVEAYCLLNEVIQRTWFSEQKT